MQTEKKPTGYPSIDKPWLKYYREGSEERANNIPKDKTVWEVIEEKLIEDNNIPAMEYFGRTISRQEFINLVYTWAKVFKAMGVKENEVIPFYGPFFPDVCAMTFALNIIGACPYFLKLAISANALAEETKESRFAVVFEDMWANVCNEFTKQRFEKIIIVKATDGMATPQKQIVSMLSKLKSKTAKTPKEDRFYSVAKALEFAELFNGDVKASFVSNRAAFITSSSGTTVGGVVKGTVATNESTISQLFMARESEVQFFKGDRCLNHFPPTASTSLNVLFFLALYKGLTIILDPRVSEKDFYNQITKLKPNVALTTGSSWEVFFNTINKEMESGKTFDFGFAKGWTVGGEGTDVEKFQKWNTIMKRANADKCLFSGYGSSELFSGTCVEKANARYDYSKQIMSVGIPYTGITLGVYDENGQELKFGERGELRIKSLSAMKEYYNKADLTKLTKIDGWILTGDLAEIDQNGFVYIYGRVSDKIELPNGEYVYLFDIANKIKEFSYINDAIVLVKENTDNEIKLVAHIVWNDTPSDENKAKRLEELNASLSCYLPQEISVYGYSEYQDMLPYSPTTLKKDKNKLSQQIDGFIQAVNGKLEHLK